MGGARHRQKGNRIERELVQLHKDIGVHCERYPLSGASRFLGSGHDLDVYARGRDEAPFVAEVKARKNG
jgi:Holliday junction resolvase